MANYKPTVLTNAAIEMQGLVQSSKRLVYTHAVIGSGEIRRLDTARARRIPGVEMRVNVVSVEATGDGIARVRIAFDNRNVRNGIFIRSIGLYARIDHLDLGGALSGILDNWQERFDSISDGEILDAIRPNMPDINILSRPYILPTLYAITEVDNPDFLPPYNGTTVVEYNLDIMVVVGRAKNVAITVPKDAVTLQRAMAPSVERQIFSRPGETVKIKIRNFADDHAYIFNAEWGDYKIRGDTIHWKIPLSPESRTLGATVQALAPGLSVSEPATISVGIIGYNKTIAKPHNLWPRDGRGVSGRALLVASRYDDRAIFNRHKKTTFLVGDSDDFTSDTASYETIAHFHRIPRLVVNKGVDYYWRTRFLGSRGLRSDWSDVTKFFVRGGMFDLTAFGNRRLDTSTARLLFRQANFIILLGTIIFNALLALALIILGPPAALIGLILLTIAVIAMIVIGLAIFAGVVIVGGFLGLLAIAAILIIGAIIVIGGIVVIGGIAAIIIIPLLIIGVILILPLGIQMIVALVPIVGTLNLLVFFVLFIIMAIIQLISLITLDLLGWLWLFLFAFVNFLASLLSLYGFITIIISWPLFIISYIFAALWAISKIIIIPII